MCGCALLGVCERTHSCVLQWKLLIERVGGIPALPFRQKVSFYLSVNLIWITCLIMFRHPSFMPLFHTGVLTTLMASRVFLYRRQGYIYFMLDLCYFANLLLMIYLTLLPAHAGLLSAVWALCQGPVIWGIVQWRNSLVFHSLDKITSCYIHLFPCITLYTLRWLTPDHVLRDHYPAVLQLKANGLSLDPASPLPTADPLGSNMFPAYKDMIFWATSAHIVWQLGYSLFVYGIKGKKVTSGLRVTSFSWLLGSAHTQKKGVLYTATRNMGSVQSYAVFVFLQFAFTLATMLPTPIYYLSQYAHSLLLIAMLNVAVWNGATYYIEVFGKMYASTLKDVRTEMDLASSPTNTSTPKRGSNAFGTDSPQSR